MKHPWWRSAVVYEIYVRSFADGDGDGVGDLAGVRSRLPYLAELGVDAIWLTPFYVSPMADGGYDVADHRDVDPLFGSLADFDALVGDAHRLGLRVIVDVVPNHTSDQHPWFRAALAAAPGSPERARYIFRPGRGEAGELPPNNWQSVFSGPAWSRVTEPDGRPGEWYLHLFAPEQPDLNWRDPRVHAEYAGVLRHWLDRGVDGIRIDVAMGLYKQEGLPDVRGEEGGFRHDSPIWSRPEVHDVYRHWRALLDSYPGERMAVGEVWTDDPADLARYTRPDELHQSFNFLLLEAPWSAEGFRKVIDNSLTALGRVDFGTTWVLSNHDVIRHRTRYGDGELGLRRARAAALLLLALPGSAYLYQGEELGLAEVTDLPDAALRDPIWRRSGGRLRGRDGCRVPVPWSGDRSPYGFAPDGVTPWLPMPRWREMTVASQSAEPTSTLSLYREALALRRRLDELGVGPMRWSDAPAEALALARGETFRCVVNFGHTPVPLPPHSEVLLASSPIEGAPGPGVPMEGKLPGATAVWLRVLDPGER